MTINCGWLNETFFFNRRMREQPNQVLCGRKRNTQDMMEVTSRDNSMLRDNHLSPGKG